METQSPHDLLLKHAQRLPRLSLAVQQVFGELSKTDVNVRKLATLIEQDVVLSSYMLQISNSAAYGCRGRITSVRHAVSIVGLERLRMLIMSLSVLNIGLRITLPPQFDLLRFNRHSVTTAVAADILVQLVPSIYPEGAFLTGLLHDIGKLVYASVLPEEYCQVLKVTEITGAPVEQCERELLGFDHAQIGFEILSRWGVSLPIARAVLAHHSEPLPDEIAKPDIALREIVRSADVFSRTVEQAQVEQAKSESVLDLPIEAIVGIAPRFASRQYAAERFASMYLDAMRCVERDILTPHAASASREAVPA
jgi:putative nucleotidyltransferase with HDIG domain